MTCAARREHDKSQADKMNARRFSMATIIPGLGSGENLN